VGNFLFHNKNFFTSKTFFRSKASRGHASLRMAGEAFVCEANSTGLLREAASV
jgi:hypothetical protein